MLLRRCEVCGAEIVVESGAIRIRHELGKTLCDECVEAIEKYGKGEGSDV